MSGLINSRYRIRKTLGEDPQGSIFLVEDTLYENSQAALKTIHSGGMDDVLLANLRAEFITLSKFKHPNIARVFDVGNIHSTDLDGYLGSLFFTMEYIEGSDLFRFTDTADWDCICDLVFQIGHALDYIHRHGLIHFDIKPANIIVTDPDEGGYGLVKIIDFGFAAPRLEPAGQPIRGTLEYMAPELLRGDTYDHRVDLYSLGVTLYEIIARHTPFHGSTATETIKQHLSSPVPTLHGRHGDVPAYFAELVTLLLQKDPGSRIESGADVVRYLQDRNPMEHYLQTVLEHVPVHHLVGRREDAQRLAGCLLDNPNGTADDVPRHPAVVVVTGESGIGKTALLEHVQLRAKTEGRLFFDTRCFVRNAQPYEPFLKMLRDQIAYVKSFGRKGDEVLQKHAEFLQRVCGTDADSRPTRMAQHIDDPEMRLHFVDLWARFFFGIASLSPYAVWIDNIDDADESTLELFLYMVRSAHRHRLIFFITGRTGSNLAFLLQTLPPSSVESFALTPLDVDAVVEFMKVFLNVDVIEKSLAAMIIAKLGGSPSLLLELLSQYMTLPHEQRAAAVEEDLRTPWEHGKIADAVTQIYVQKVSLRKPEELFLLRALSCFDTPVPLSLLQHIAPFTPLRVKFFLDLLLNVGIIHSIDNGSRWFISQSRFKEFVYASLGAEKHMLHALIADTMVLDNDARQESAEIIAHHYTEAGNSRNAFPFYLTAAGQKRSQYALHESLSLLNAACACLPSEEIDITVFENLAECYSLAGDYQNAILLYEQLRTDAADESKRYKYAKELGLINSREGHLDDAYRLLLEASSIARTAEEIIDVEEELSIIDISRGKYTDAFERSSRILQSYGSLENSAAITGILNNLGIIHFYQNNPEEAVECFRRSISILQNEHQKSKLISPYLNLGNVYSAQEQFAEAARHWQHALALSQEVGNVQQEARAYNNIGIASFHQGNHDDACSQYEKAHEIFSRLGFLPGVALCLTNIGEVRLADAQLQQAIECWEKDLALYETLHDDHGMIEIALLLSEVHLQVGHMEAAAALLGRAENLLSGSSNTAQHALFACMKGAWCEDTADHLAAKKYLEEAGEKYGGTNDHRNECLSLLKLAEAEHSLGNDRRSAELLQRVDTLAGERRYPLLQSEALLRLGIVAGDDRIDGLEPAITYFTRAFDTVRTQNVTEITWRVCYHLGNEYLRRGLHEKGVLHFRYGIQAMEFIAGGITSDDLRRDYLTSRRRGDLLREMRAAADALAPK